MKKLLSALLAITMLVTAAFFGTATASAEENLFDTFDYPLGGFIYNCGNGPYDADDIGYWAGQQYDDDDFKNIEWDGENITEPDYEDGYSHYRQFPADKFDSFVHEVFEFEGDFRELIKAQEYVKTVEYHEADNTYIVLWDSGKGGGSIQLLRGYAKNGDTYSCYYQEAEWFETLEDIDCFLKEILKEEGKTHETEKDRIITDEYGFYNFIISDSATKIDVSYNGKYIKILGSEEVDSIPALSELITKDTQKPSVRYELEKGIKVEGDTAFPAGTVITAKNVTSGTMLDASKKALAEIMTNDKIAVFDIAATANNTAVQPNGKVKVTFDLPENLSFDNLKLFYISEDGKAEEIKTAINKSNKTVSAELEHFSTYALCNVKAETATGAAASSEAVSTDIPKAGDESNLFIPIILSAISLFSISLIAIFTKKKNRE